jgi:hypothetical protein
MYDKIMNIFDETLEAEVIAKSVIICCKKQAYHQQSKIK